ncbi:hypothetical protein [Nocardia mexicana]|uniref:Alpha-glucoside transport system permease protein n=1 Tax=Nocardia mexicana TaxID=279262 RepID=A0A370HEH4_9NOCA|nr:hypothetical protein [Nocardia mexicana]RDI55631.1 alpha-glucoside transport system permease protein [Nocardia mexicana]
MTSAKGDVPQPDSAVHTIRAHGLELELATRRMAGPVIGGRNLSGLTVAAAQLPALALLVTMLVVPAVATVVMACGSDSGRVITAWCAEFLVAGLLLTRIWRTRPRPVEGVLRGPRETVGPKASDDEAGAPRSSRGRRGELSAWIVAMAAPGATIGVLDPRHHGFVLYSALFAAAALAFVWFPGRDRRMRWPVPVAIPVVGIVAAVAVTARALGADGARAYAWTLAWVVVAAGVLIFALGFAWTWRRTWWPWWPLIVPFAVSAFVAGLAFRLVSEPLVNSTESVLLQLVLYFLMLVVTFVWSWFGAVFVLLRTASDAVETDPVRRGFLGDPPKRRLPRMDWRGRWQWVKRLIHLVNPVLLILGLVLAVAAARVFDVVLVAVPASQQYVLETSTVYWWRLTVDDPSNRAAAAAYSLPLAVVVGLGAWVLQAGVRRHRARWTIPSARAVPVHLPLVPVPRAEQRPRRNVVRRRTWTPGRLGPRVAWLFTRVGLMSLLMLSPVIVLIVAGWAGLDGPAFTGPRAVWHDSELWRALWTTATVTVVATLLTVTAALPPAFYAASLPPKEPKSRVVVAILVVLAALPAQVYAGPIRAFIEDNSLAGTSMPLILAHASIGLPIAILILRGALLAPEDSPIADARRGLVPIPLAARRALITAGPAVGAVGVLEMVQIWNDFFIGQLVGGADASPWSLLLWSEARQFHESVAHLAAGALLAALPPVVLVLLTWRRFLVPGLTGGVLR